MGLTINQDLATRLAQALMTSMTDQKAWTFETVREKILAVLDAPRKRLHEDMREMLDALDSTRERIERQMVSYEGAHKYLTEEVERLKAAAGQQETEPSQRVGELEEQVQALQAEKAALSELYTKPQLEGKEKPG